MIVYHIQAHGGVGDDGSYAQTTLVNAETGNVIHVLPLRELHWLTYAPDGSQIAALTYDELRVYDTQAGQLQFSIPVSLKFGTGGHGYSPHGQTILVLSSAGFIGVNAANGTWREIPLAYESIGGCGDALPAPPDITWIDEASFFMLVPNNVGYPPFLVWVDADRLWVMDGGVLQLLSIDGEDIHAKSIASGGWNPSSTWVTKSRSVRHNHQRLRVDAHPRLRVSFHYHHKKDHFMPVRPKTISPHSGSWKNVGSRFPARIRGFPTHATRRSRNLF